MKPSPQEIIDAVAAYGSIRKASAACGWARSSVQDWIAEHGIKAEVEAAKARALAASEHVEAPMVPSPDDHDAIRLVGQAAEIRALKRALKQHQEALANRAEVVQQIVDAARIPVEAPAFAIAPQDGELPERSIVLPIFDLQYGQFVRPEDVPFGKGGFTEAIFDDRLAAYVDKVCRFLRDRAASTRFTEAHIVLGGDLVEGSDIFAGQTWQLHSDPVRQTLDLRVKLRGALLTMIRFLREQLGARVVAVYAVPGNHGKLGGKRSGAMPTTASWDWLLGELLRDDLSGHVDLFVNESAGALMFETLGHTFLTVHGDEVKGHSGIPFYGLTRFDGRAIRLAEAVYDYCLLGHHHQPATIPNGSGGEFIMSGDWVGGNNLSKWIVAASRPQQRVLLVGAKYGVATDERIYFDDRTARHRPRIYNARRAAA